VGANPVSVLKRQNLVDSAGRLAQFYGVPFKLFSRCDGLYQGAGIFKAAAMTALEVQSARPMKHRAQGRMLVN
jgi:hypothetical protein